MFTGFWEGGGDVMVRVRFGGKSESEGMRVDILSCFMDFVGVVLLAGRWIYLKVAVLWYVALLQLWRGNTGQIEANR